MSRLRDELMSKPGLKVGQRDSCVYLIESYDFYSVGHYLTGACLRTICFEAYVQLCAGEACCPRGFSTRPGSRAKQ